MLEPDMKVSPPISDEDLVKLLAQYDREIFRYVFTLVPERGAAEDVHQETAAALWRKRAEYDSSQPFLPWAYRFAKFEALRHRKQAGRHPLSFDDTLISELAERRAADQSVIESRRSALDNCMSQLSSDERRLIEARYSQNQSIAQLAKQTAAPVKGLYHAIDRVRRRLMECIKRRLKSEGAL
jgi:RNA polymerase sigma-70 factor (ECF subfamily)